VLGLTATAAGASAAQRHRQPSNPQITSLSILINDEPGYTGAPASTNLCAEICPGAYAGRPTSRTVEPNPHQQTINHSSTVVTPVAGTPAAIGRITVSNGGFDWAAAGIGAGGMLALALLGLGGALTLMRRRNHRIRDQHAG
jgi:hypothetical protein